MERVSQRQAVNQDARVEASEPPSSPHAVQSQGFSERSSCCSLNEDSCCGLVGWACAIWGLFCDFWSCIFGCGAPPVDIDEADQPDSSEQVALGLLLPPAEEVAKVKAFLEKYRADEGILKAESERGEAYLKEFDKLPVKATDPAVDALCVGWEGDEISTGFACVIEKNPDARQTINFNALIREKLKNNLNHAIVRETLNSWCNGTKLASDTN